MNRFEQEAIYRIEEEIEYEKWRLSGGPERDEKKHAKLAHQSLINLQVDGGWKVLEIDMIQEIEREYSLVEAVIRKGYAVEIIRWNPFNKGWMRRSHAGGWVIFKESDYL